MQEQTGPTLPHRVLRHGAGPVATVPSLAAKYVHRPVAFWLCMPCCGITSGLRVARLRVASGSFPFVPVDINLKNVSPGSLGGIGGHKRDPPNPPIRPQIQNLRTKRCRLSPSGASGTEFRPMFGRLVPSIPPRCSGATSFLRHKRQTAKCRATKVPLVHGLPIHALLRVPVHHAAMLEQLPAQEQHRRRRRLASRVLACHSLSRRRRRRSLRGHHLVQTLEPTEGFTPRSSLPTLIPDYSCDGGEGSLSVW